METLLSKNSDINVVYTINEPAAAGAYNALKKAGKEKGVLIVSVDGARGAVGYGAEKTGLRPRGAGDEGEGDKHERQNGKRSFQRPAAR